MDTGAAPLVEGMAVIGSDMQRVGQVSSIRTTDFGVDRPLQPDVYVPFDAIAEVNPNVNPVGNVVATPSGGGGPGATPSTTAPSPTTPAPTKSGTYVPDIIVLLTDGISEEGDSISLAREAGAQRVTTSTVGLGQDVNRGYLEKVAHEDLDLDRLASETIGQSPAALKFIVNESVINAHFNGRSKINYGDFTVALDNHEVGLRHPIRNMLPADKRALAYHDLADRVAPVHRVAEPGVRLDHRGLRPALDHEQAARM